VDEPRATDAFDRELRRTLAAAGKGASGPHVDAELAAAWMERRLDSAAALALETHLAGCADCQTLFATLARIVPEETAAPAALTWWRRVRTGWLVPAAVAAAAALVMWVAVPQQRAANPTSPPSQPREQAAVPQASAPPAAAPAQAPEAAAAADRRSAPGRPATQAKAAAPLATSELERRDRLADAAAAPPVESPKETVVATGQSPSADVQAARRGAVAGGAPAPAVPAAPAAPAVERQEAAAPSRDQPARDNATFATGLRGLDLMVVAADGAAHWRRTGTRVEFAPRADAGFTAVSLPVSADAIVAGSAPGGTVCWFVGGDGLVLLTTDGVRFTRVLAPATTALVGVTAADARTATVTLADGRRFRTTDGGASWTPLP
jgi:hypothetical protein